MDWGNTMNILNNWKMLDLVTRDGEELVCIEGRVYGSNPRFPSSSHIRTSPITAYTLDGNSMIVTTRRGSEYVLGKPEPTETFAQQRLLRRLSRLTPASAQGFDGIESQLTGFDESDRQKRPLATAKMG